ncbi:GDP-L-galactose phosphorylase 1-like [Aristolochia californica]|uniref:GDP-L-galactose phosphorylase 1-like n=1 Tax=Aristolochia californica TaxID=171875 RepID=UPI0035D68C02
MVSVKQLEDEYCLFKGTKGSELSHCSHPLKDIRIPIYQFGSVLARGSVATGVVPCAAEEQSLLDTLFLAQWENCAWKGLFRYDVMACETKVIQGRMGFVAQFNELWRSNHLPNTENNVSELGDDVLFCVKNGEKTNSELIPSARVPRGADLVIANANPIEYGHVFMVPHSSHQRTLPQLARSLEMVIKVAAEIKNPSFHAFCDYYPSYSGGHHGYFEACYFANPLPVECVPVRPIAGVWQEKGIHICELEGYPLKTLSFKSKENLQGLVTVVSKICSCLLEQNTAFNLLVSNCGTEIFLFLQVDNSSPAVPAWECSGHFVFNSRLKFDLSTEDVLVKLLAAVSLGENEFQAMKLMCCEVTGRIAS